VKKQEIKRNSPCGKLEREKEFELHTVSERILDVVWNMMWSFITAHLALSPENSEQAQADPLSSS